MAVTETRTYKARRDKRRSSAFRLETPIFSKCGNCGELKIPHRACGYCGFYKGIKVIDLKQA